MVIYLLNEATIIGQVISLLTATILIPIYDN